MQAHPMVMTGNNSMLHRCPSQDSNECYGEPTVVGLKWLLRQWPTECTVNGRSVFYDVGAGFGRLTAFMRLHTNASRVRGIEINSCRHQQSLAVRDSVRRAAPSAGDLDFLLGDARKLGMADATHAFLACQCWSETLLVDVWRLLTQTAPHLRCVVVLSRRLPEAWSDRVGALAASFGHVVAVNPVATTYRGASAVFFRRGECVDPSTSTLQRATTVGKASASSRRCWSAADVLAATNQQGVSMGMPLVAARVW